jgi:hypothetical protein
MPRKWFGLLWFGRSLPRKDRTATLRKEQRNLRGTCCTTCCSLWKNNQVRKARTVSAREWVGSGRQDTPDTQVQTHQWHSEMSPAYTECIRELLHWMMTHSSKVHTPACLDQGQTYQQDIGSTGSARRSSWRSLHCMLRTLLCSSWC